MNELHPNTIVSFVEKNIGQFHQKRLDKLAKLDLLKVLKRKNPYLFKVKNFEVYAELVKSLLDAFLQSQEETLFGNFMEDLAIFICQQVYGGFKSSLEGIDLEFEKGGIKYIVEIKSGPNWANSSQLKKMKQNFINAQKILKKQNPELQIIAVNGCCYGIDKKPEKDGYIKYCGQQFWSLISGNENLYLEIIEPLGHQAKAKNEAFKKGYAVTLNRFTTKFAQHFVKDGVVEWEKLVKFNASFSS